MKYYSFDQIVMVGFILLSLDLHNNICVGSDNGLYTLHGRICDERISKKERLRLEEFIK